MYRHFASAPPRSLGVSELWRSHPPPLHREGARLMALDGPRNCAPSSAAPLSPHTRPLPPRGARYLRSARRRRGASAPAVAWVQRRARLRARRGAIVPAKCGRMAFAVAHEQCRRLAPTRPFCGRIYTLAEGFAAPIGTPATPLHWCAERRH